MKILTKEQILRMHARLAAETGGAAGLRDESLLDSAIHAPFQSFGGAELYPTVTAKAARLGYGIIHNHPFADGNKRTGTHVMLVTLALNGITPDFADGELISLILRTAAGELDETDLCAAVQGAIRNAQ